ncbi:DUF5060 domain-containing protein [Aquimarina algiphila]|uniref:DUF5060 domain-containing protein n=1 Tax=Aquimarina algiphila TaxID=2047982 RepID=UPI0024931912|nr:DUF5060 domain-containing protein [Aquimarina algiphila]
MQHTKTKLIKILTIFFITAGTLTAQFNVKINGNFKKWYKLTLNFEGFNQSENDEDNPFLNYRLNVTFTNGNSSIVVPGFYAADGKAAETSSKQGNVWKVRFVPNSSGTWTYKASFRRGDAVAVNDDPNFGEAVAFDGVVGSFEISNTTDRPNGRLYYANERYLRYSETNKPFLKGGADSPENFLGYYEFDQTPATHKYEPHKKDWKTGDPTWQNGKGKNIIGALNYLASKDMNAVYFLTMNVQGDGKDVWPWNSRNERYRFDCSKLDQWEIVFDHMDNLGLMLHIVTQETENELLLDIGQLDVQRKLYYRELIARFSHHLGVTWNLGEENGPVHWSPKGQDDNDRKAMAKYIKTHDPYKNFIALHTHSVPEEQGLFLNPLLGYKFLDGPSVQIHIPELVHETTLKWINKSEKTTQPWVVALDEFGPADVGVKPDAYDPNHDEIRHHVLWGNLMAGGAGVEWYFGYKFAHMDINCEDWRSRDKVWDQTKYALDFFNAYLPFTEMYSADGLTTNPKDYVFAKNNEVYAVYLPKVIETKLNLYDSDKTFSIAWYNPREGGELKKGTVKKINGGSNASIGFPPNKDKDWVALIQSTDTKKANSNALQSEALTLDALVDFNIKFDKANTLSYYQDLQNGVLAIDASNKDSRNKFASAITKFKGKSGVYKMNFVSMAENDGESKYLIKINGKSQDTIVNPETSETFKIIRHSLDNIYLHYNDIIEIESNAVTNGKIPENDETAWSRGRWSSLILIPEGLSIKKRLKDTQPFEEKEGVLDIEAEDYHFKTKNGTEREWIKKSTKDNDNEVLIETANNKAYIEAYPDTRVTHDDALIHGENFFPVAGVGGVVSYKIKINNPGKYYIWVSAFSTGTEDNGVHVGVNDTWPESGARMQWCAEKGKWTWSSAQRVPDNHCGVEKAIYLEFEKSDEYIISFSMREDGFKMDRFILSKDTNFKPK